MCDGKDELTKKELKHIEYEQSCGDWRHRDSMLWQSLAVAMTLTGAVFVAAFNENVVKVWMLRPFLFFLSSLVNFLLLLKITKDHYYQLGSSDLLLRLESNKLRGDEQINPDGLKEPFRIWKPSKSYFNEQLREERMNECKNKIPCTCLYKWLRNLSAFKGFFWTQFFLVIVSLAYFFLSLFYWRN